MSVTDVTVAEGIDELGSLRGIAMGAGEITYQKIPAAIDLSKQLLDAANIKMPEILPLRKVHVATRKNWFWSEFSFNFRSNQA